MIADFLLFVKGIFYFPLFFRVGIAVPGFSEKKSVDKSGKNVYNRENKKKRGVCMEQTYRFAAGVTVLPDDLREEICQELGNFGGLGISLPELDCRAPQFAALLENTREQLREVLNVPQNYRVLLMSGGAAAQYAAVPLNLLSEHRFADYLLTGQYARRAYQEAKKFGDIAIAASSGGATPPFSSIPTVEKSAFRPDTDYVFYRANDDIYGTRFTAVPDTGNLPLAVDLTGCFLSESIDVSRFGLLFADTANCLGAAGMAAVVVREDLVGHERAGTPASLCYREIAEAETPACLPSILSVAVANRVLGRIREIGGVDELKRRCERKAVFLYDYLDSQQYYTVPVDIKYRSVTSVVFSTGSARTDEQFAADAEKEGLLGLRGDASVGGLRAYLGNFLPYEGVKALVSFMRRFAMLHPHFTI